MVGCGRCRKKLKADRLHWLRWRVAIRLGYRSVDEWQIDTPADQQAEQLAVAWLDRWGEESQLLAAVVHNSALVAASASGVTYKAEAFKNPSDYERELGTAEHEQPRQDWAAFQAVARRIAIGQ